LVNNAKDGDNSRNVERGVMHKKILVRIPEVKTLLGRPSIDWRRMAFK
jgi:hypothetical protein